MKLKRSLIKKTKTEDLKMNFVDWVVQNSENWTPDQKRTFTEMLKNQADAVKTRIEDSLIDWSMLFVMRTKQPFIIQRGQSKKISQDIFDAYCKHFNVESEKLS